LGLRSRLLLLQRLLMADADRPSLRGVRIGGAAITTASAITKPSQINKGPARGGAFLDGIIGNLVQARHASPSNSCPIRSVAPKCRRKAMADVRLGSLADLNVHQPTSAFPLNADMFRVEIDVRLVPRTDLPHRSPPRGGAKLRLGSSRSWEYSNHVC